MQVLRGSAGVDPKSGPYAVGIGIFDGVHRGHQTLFAKVLALAEAAGIGSMAFTFDPHPAKVLSPQKAPKLIESVDTRLERLGGLGLSAAVVEPFTLELAAMPAEDFARAVLHERLGARHVVVGADFTFGKGRGGDVHKLAAWGVELGFGVHPIDIVRVDGVPVSSSKVREYVAAGAMRGATLLLGRHFCLHGVVVRGQSRGAKIGFATANLSTHNELLPAVGVYAGRASGSFGTRNAVVNIGFAPTFGDNALTIEAHLLDYAGGPLYGAAISLDFIDRLRDERRFASVLELKAQIAADVAEARRLLTAG